MEIWKDAVGYEGLYKVSNLGRVLDVESGKIRKLVHDKDGYLQLGLMKNGKRFFPKVHRLVAEAFIENPSKLPLINHKDENKENNFVENLEWCTHSYNVTYGSRSMHSVLKQFSKNWDFIEQYESIADAIRATGVDRKTIYRCCNDEKRVGGGFKWRLAHKGDEVWPQG